MEDSHDSELLARAKDRFFSKTRLAEAIRPGMDTLCLEWQAWRSDRGYGQFRLGTRHIRAHRVAWEMEHGPIPDGLQVLHKCDNPPCVNAEHLFLGTHADNMHDMIAKGRKVVSRGDRNGSRLHPRSLARGERNGFAKLTDEKVRTVFQLHSEGWNQRRIGVELGVSGVNIGLILARRRWAHVQCLDVLP